MTSLTIVIPAYNESLSIREVLTDIKSFSKNYDFKLIVVDDASKDNTKKIIEEFIDNDTIRLFCHKINKGYGAAIKTGIQNTHTDYVITIDADGQHRTEDILKLYGAIRKLDADMIVGGRLGQKSSTTLRGIGKFLIRLFVKMTIRIPVKDINSGMKIYKTDIAKKNIRLCPDGMAFSDVVTISFVYTGHYVGEIPIIVNNRIAGKSTISYKTAFETIKEILFIAIVFVPYKFFSFLSLFMCVISLSWGLPFIIMGKGITTGSALGFFVSIILWSLGIIAQLVSGIRKDML